MGYLVRLAYIIGAAALLAGCGGSQPPIGGPGALTPTARSSARQATGRQQLIYVIDNNLYKGSHVSLYSYPDGKPEGKLTGLGVLYGACADSHGDVFIVSSASASTSTIIEYPPGGTSPINVFYDLGYTATGCSVDPKTGNLAVANFYAYNYTSGTITIFRNAAARPVVLTVPDIFSPRYCGYDANGNLFLVGYTKNLQILFAELPAGSTQFTGITLNQAINEPGNLEWDGKYMAIGDSSTNVIYQFSMNGSTGTEVGSTTLGGVNYYLTQFWIVGSKVVGAAAVDKKVGIWKYPAGGAAVKLIKQKSDIPIGVAVTSP